MASTTRFCVQGPALLLSSVARCARVRVVAALRADKGRVDGPKDRVRSPEMSCQKASKGRARSTVLLPRMHSNFRKGLKYRTVIGTKRGVQRLRQRYILAIVS